jgi:glycosyltransferase involved in cell wall biosynthesis
MTPRRGRAVPPERIDQVIPTIVEHDAVSNHTFEAQRILQKMGFVSEIYAQVIGPGCDGRVRPLAELPSYEDGRQWVLYQHSIGSPAAEVVACHPGVRLIDYHNITPAELVEQWVPQLGPETRLGRAQLRMLAPLVEAAFADSRFNAAELEAAGYRQVRVAPLLIDEGNLKAPADEAVLSRLRAAKSCGGADWLFVGQLAPHKAQHDVVKAFAAFRHCFDPNARLHLVGREMGNAYRDALSAFVDAIGLGTAVELTGSVSTAALAAYYETADVFVCCSDHEGFCAPIIEAMQRGVPVVAYAAAAVTETVAEAGVLLSDKAPAVVAAAVDEVIRGSGVRKLLVEAGRRQASRYGLEQARRAFQDAIDASIAGMPR